MNTSNAAPAAPAASVPPSVADWKPRNEDARIPPSFFARLAHVHADSVYMGWYGPFVLLFATISSGIYLLYRGVIYGIDFLLSLRKKS